MGKVGQKESKQSDSFSSCLLTLPPECDLEDDFSRAPLLGNSSEPIPLAAADGFVTQT